MFLTCSLWTLIKDAAPNKDQTMMSYDVFGIMGAGVILSSAALGLVLKFYIYENE